MVDGGNLPEKEISDDKDKISRRQRDMLRLRHFSKSAAAVKTQSSNDGGEDVSTLRSASSGRATLPSGERGGKMTRMQKIRASKRPASVPKERTDSIVPVAVAAATPAMEDTHERPHIPKSRAEKIGKFRKNSSSMRNAAKVEEVTPSTTGTITPVPISRNQKIGNFRSPSLKSISPVEETTRAQASQAPSPTPTTPKSRSEKIGRFRKSSSFKTLTTAAKVEDDAPTKSAPTQRSSSEGRVEKIGRFRSHSFHTICAESASDINVSNPTPDSPSTQRYSSRGRAEKIGKFRKTASLRSVESPSIRGLVEPLKNAPFECSLSQDQSDNVKEFKTTPLPSMVQPDLKVVEALPINTTPPQCSGFKGRADKVGKFRKSRLLSNNSKDEKDSAHSSTEEIDTKLRTSGPTKGTQNALLPPSLAISLTRQLSISNSNSDTASSKSTESAHKSRHISTARRDKTFRGVSRAHLASSLSRQLSASVSASDGDGDGDETSFKSNDSSEIASVADKDRKTGDFPGSRLAMTLTRDLSSSTLKTDADEASSKSSESSLKAGIISAARRRKKYDDFSGSNLAMVLTHQVSTSVSSSGDDEATSNNSVSTSEKSEGSSSTKKGPRGSKEEKLERSQENGKHSVAVEAKQPTLNEVVRGENLGGRLSSDEPGNLLGEQPASANLFDTQKIGSDPPAFKNVEVIALSKDTPVSEGLDFRPLGFEDCVTKDPGDSSWDTNRVYFNEFQSTGAPEPSGAFSAFTSEDSRSIVIDSYHKEEEEKKEKEPTSGQFGFTAPDTKASFSPWPQEVSDTTPAAQHDDSGSEQEVLDEVDLLGVSSSGIDGDMNQDYSVADKTARLAAYATRYSDDSSKEINSSSESAGSSDLGNEDTEIGYISQGSDEDMPPVMMPPPEPVIHNESVPTFTLSAKVAQVSDEHIATGHSLPQCMDELSLLPPPPPPPGSKKKRSKRKKGEARIPLIDPPTSEKFKKWEQNQERMIPSLMDSANNKVERIDSLKDAETGSNMNNETKGTNMIRQVAGASPFEAAMRKESTLPSMFLDFLGDPVAVCRIKMVNKACYDFIDKHEHKLMQNAVRLGGMQTSVRPYFWLWVTLEKGANLSNNTDDGEIPEPDVRTYEQRGREGQWHSVIERDVARSFGNLPPHKTGARLRTDSIVRALATWGRCRVMKRGVKGSGNAPPLSRTISEDSGEASLAPTDTVSDWGGVTPVGSFGSFDGPSENRRFQQISQKEKTESKNISKSSTKITQELALTGEDFSESKKKVLREKLSFILNALSAAHENIGYCQGMDYVVAHLLRQLQETLQWKAVKGELPLVIKSSSSFCPRLVESEADFALAREEVDQTVIVEEACFRIMDAFFTNYDLAHFYWPELRCLKTCGLVFEKLIKRQLPVLADHFEHQELNVSIFALGWFQTLFLYLPSMPSATVCHMWDIWLVERSFKIFFRVGTAILFLSQPLLLNHDLEGMMGYLNTFPDATLLSPDILIACALQMKVTNSLLKELEEEVTAEMM